MKLFVIVICLLSERFLIHRSAYSRFYWFNNYCDRWLQWIEPLKLFKSPWGQLLAIVSPLLLIAAVVLFLLGNILFGVGGFILNVIMVHYCIGPDNPFYPRRSNERANDLANSVGQSYLVAINGQLFVVIFWYIVGGPLSVLFYRLISLIYSRCSTNEKATYLLDCLDWLPARTTSMLYLLAGNFHTGFQVFSSLFFTLPKNNALLLNQCGMAALKQEECADEAIFLPSVEALVERSLIVLLILLSFLTLVAWM